MDKRNQDLGHPIDYTKGFLAGALFGGLAGAGVMLLLAPQSGRRTRAKLQQKGIELRDRTNEMVGETLAHVRSNPNIVEMSVKNYEQLEHVSDTV